MTSHESTSVYSGDELQKFAPYVEWLKQIGGAGGYSACVVGQYRALFLRWGYLTVSLGRLMKFFSEDTILLLSRPRLPDHSP